MYTRLRLVALFGFSQLLGLPVQAAPFDGVEISTLQAGPGVYMLVGAGGNIGVAAGDDGVFLIDDQFAPLTDRILAAIGKISDKPIRFLLNTHWHPDHTGGNENLGRSGIVIVAHDNVRRSLTRDQFIEAFNMSMPAAPREALPVVTFNDSVTFHLNGEDILVCHVPRAHTDGDSIVHFPRANVIHMGDTFFEGRFPFIDVAHGGSVAGLIAAVDEALSLANDKTVVIPGHGPISNREGLVRYRKMLIDLRDRVQAMVKGGDSLVEIKEAWLTEEYEEVLQPAPISPEKFIEILYTDLSR